MISNEELITRAKHYLTSLPDSPRKTFIKGIINNVEAYENITPKQHTILTAFCMQQDIYRAQNKGELPKCL